MEINGNLLRLVEIGSLRFEIGNLEIISPRLIRLGRII